MMMKIFGESIETIHNTSWPYILNHCSKISITGDTGPRKTDPLLNLIKH